MLSANALCATGPYDPEMWFPYLMPNGASASRAKLVCAGCPARTECLLLALTAEAGLPEMFRWGIYGGLDPAERARFAERGRVPKPRESGPRAWFHQPGALRVVAGWRDGWLGLEQAAAMVGVTTPTWLEGIRGVVTLLHRSGEALPLFRTPGEARRVTASDPVSITRVKQARRVEGVGCAAPDRQTA